MVLTLLQTVFHTCALANKVGGGGGGVGGGGRGGGGGGGGGFDLIHSQSSLFFRIGTEPCCYGCFLQ